MLRGVEPPDEPAKEERAPEVHGVEDHPQRTENLRRAATSSLCSWDWCSRVLWRSSHKSCSSTGSSQLSALAKKYSAVRLRTSKAVRTKRSSGLAAPGLLFADALGLTDSPGPIGTEDAAPLREGLLQRPVRSVAEWSAKAGVQVPGKRHGAGARNGFSRIATTQRRPSPKLLFIGDSSRVATIVAQSHASSLVERMYGL